MTNAERHDLLVVVDEPTAEDKHGVSGSNLQMAGAGGGRPPRLQCEVLGERAIGPVPMNEILERCRDLPQFQISVVVGEAWHVGGPMADRSARNQYEAFQPDHGRARWVAEKARQNGRPG